MVDIYEAVVRDSTMWWVEWSGLEFFSILGLPTICVLDRQDMLSSDLGLGMLNRDEFRLGEMFCQLTQLAPNICATVAFTETETTLK